MKKCWVLFLLLLLLISGCSNQEPEQSQSTTLPLVTLPPAYYEENSSLEVATEGAIKQYRLPDNSYKGIYCTGSGLLLATGDNMTKLQMLTGETCIPSSSFVLEHGYPAQCRALSNGFVYYDETEHVVRYLDLNLTQRHSVVLSREMTSPVISHDGTVIYYCQDQEIRAMDVENNISRLLKTQNVKKQSLIDVYFDSTVLACAIEGETGETETVFISTQDGRNIKTENGIANLYTYNNKFLAQWTDGMVRQWICGESNGTVTSFAIQQTHLFGAPALDGAVGYEETDAGLNLSFYQLSTGRKIAQILLENVECPDAFQEDPRSGCILMIVNDPEGEGKVLLKWDPSASSIQEDAVYTGTLYTAENPNTEALKSLQKDVDDMNAKYGVRIRIGKEATEVSGDYALVMEYQVPAIRDMLEQLEKVLQEFPKNFVYKSIRSRLRICLVRSVDGDTEGQQYWDGRNAYIAICSGSDVRSNFLKCFGLVVDSHVLGNSPVYDYWDTLNPINFRYGKPDESLISTENRVFVDMDSMTSGMCDRSRIFWQAMEPNNEELFKNEIMQKKLTMLCKAIRDAWNLEKKTDVYAWEQYLEEPIAAEK